MAIRSNCSNRLHRFGGGIQTSYAKACFLSQSAQLSSKKNCAGTHEPSFSRHSDRHICCDYNYGKN